jgi:alkaline phosphatase D
VAEAAAGAADRRIALFLHKPVFVTEPGDPTFDYWSVPPQARAALAPLLDHPGLRLVASGHLHLHHGFTRGRVAFAWAPPLSFIVNPAEQPGLPGERVCGALLHRLHADGVETVLLAPDGMEVPSLDNIRTETYPE